MRSTDLDQTSGSGVRRLDLNAPHPIVRLNAPAAIIKDRELDRVVTELAEAKAQLADAKDELARLRETLELLQRPAATEAVACAPTQDTTLQRVVVTEAPPPGETEGGRRESQRYPCEFEVEFGHDTHFIAGVSADMSTGGLFVATYRHVPVGSAVAVAFDLPGGPRIEARGEVRWVRENEAGESRPGLGIAFTDLTPSALAHIVDFCKSRPPLCFDV